MPARNGAVHVATTKRVYKGKVHPAEARAAERSIKTKLSDKFVLALVDRQDLQLEELTVPEPIGLALHGLDLVVRPLQGATRDRHVVVRQKPTAVGRQRLRHLLQHLDPRYLCPTEPIVEERRGEPLAGLLPELTEVLLHVVGHSQS